MQATKFQKYRILLCSIWTTVWNSMRVIFWSWLKNGQEARAKVDPIFNYWAQNILDIPGISFDVIGSKPTEFSSGRRYIIMSNHASLYDIPLIVRTFPNVSIRMITKKELFRVPIWGQALKASEFIAIDREDRKQAQKDLQRAREKMEDGIVIWMAPEGTRTRSGEMNPFKKGGFLLALQTEAIIIPVTIIGSGEILPPETTDFNLGEKVQIKIGQPVDTANYSVRKMRDLMAEVEAEIKQGFGNEKQ